MLYIVHGFFVTGLLLSGDGTCRVNQMATSAIVA